MKATQEDFTWDGTAQRSLFIKPSGLSGIALHVFEGGDNSTIFSKHRDKCIYEFGPTPTLLKTHESISFPEAINCIVHQFGWSPVCV